jgi:hypothetical protein
MAKSQHDETPASATADPSELSDAAPDGVEEASDAGTDRDDRFRVWAAVGIAVVSILGAGVAFSASLAEQNAHQLDLKSLQESARVEEFRSEAESTANSDLRSAAIYQEHRKAASQLAEQAAGTQDPALAAVLRVQAEHELVLARIAGQYFRGGAPTDNGDAATPVEFDRQAEIDRLLSENPELGQLHPQATLDQADLLNGRTVRLVGLVTLFIAGVLFLTLAQFTRRSIRPLLAAAGVTAAAIGILLWIVVEAAA